MKTQFLKLIIALSIITAISCKKEKNTISCKPVSITRNNNTASQTIISYDAQNRITEFKANVDIYKFNYTGLSGTIEYKTFDTIYNRTDHITLDASGRLTSYEIITRGSSPILRYYFLFTYNSDGYLFTNTQTITGGGANVYYKDSMIYSNGNLTKKITKRLDGSNYATITYSYNSDKNRSWNFFANNAGDPFSAISNSIYLYTLLGKQSTNLPTNIERIGSSYTENFTFDYSFNTDGYISEYNVLRSSPTGSYSTNYKVTYSCN